MTVAIGAAVVPLDGTYIFSADDLQKPFFVSFWIFYACSFCSANLLEKICSSKSTHGLS